MLEPRTSTRTSLRHRSTTLSSRRRGWCSEPPPTCARAGEGAVVRQTERHLGVRVQVRDAHRSARICGRRRNGDACCRFEDEPIGTRCQPPRQHQFARSSKGASRRIVRECIADISTVLLLSERRAVALPHVTSRRARHVGPISRSLQRLWRPFWELLRRGRCVRQLLVFFQRSPDFRFRWPKTSISAIARPAVAISPDGHAARLRREPSSVSDRCRTRRQGPSPEIRECRGRDEPRVLA